MVEEIKKIANVLSSTGKVVLFEPNSVLNGLETFNNKDTLNSVVNQIAIKLNNELILIKNKLIPFMNEFSKLCNEKIEKMEDTTDIAKYKINIIDIPEIITELRNSQRLENKREPLKIGQKTMSISVPKTDEIRNYFVSKDSIISAYVESLVASKTDEYLINLWEKYLSNIADSNLSYVQLFRDPVSNIDDIILLYVVTQNIYDEKPVGCSVRDDIYHTVIQVYSSEIKNLLAIIHDNILKDREIGRLVLSKKDEYTLNVDKVLYDKFLEEGGMPEALLGFCLESNTDLNNCFYGVIKGKQTEYVNKWNNKVKLEGFNSISNTVNRYGALYNIVLKLVYDAYIPKDLEELLSVDYYGAIEKLNKLLPSLSNDKVLDYNYMARLITGDIMFSNTNFSKFADNMLSYMNINKTFTQQDAATFAAFDIIVDYLISQVTLIGYGQDNVVKREYDYTWPL